MSVNSIGSSYYNGQSISQLLLGVNAIYQLNARSSMTSKIGAMLRLGVGTGSRDGK